MFHAWIVVAAVVGTIGTVQAQHPSPSPYSGLEMRSVKALAYRQIANLKAGRGMGLALPAEVNGYTGPVHVLKLGDRLGLNEEQRTRGQGLHVAMKAETVPIGERLIAQATDLDRLFATESVTLASLQVATTEIGTAQGALRLAHLRFHLSTADILTPEQVRQYGEVRGYVRSSYDGHGFKGHH